MFSETVNGILQAHSIFEDAKADYPDEPVINAYLAVTRLLDLMLRNDGGDIDTLTEVLAEYGISRTGDDLETLEFNSPLYKDEYLTLPETAPSGEAIRSFLAGPLLTAMNNSIDNLDATIANWSDSDKHIIAKEKLDADLDIELDYGDIFLFRAGLKAMKAFVLIITAYDLDVDVREVVALAKLDALNFKTFLDRYQDFLKLLPTTTTPSGNGATQLAEAKTALLGAIDDYLTASDKIRNDTNTESGAEELIEIYDCELQEEEWFRSNLTDLKDSLTNSTVFQLVDREETWEFTDDPSGDKLQVHLYDNMSEGHYHGLGSCDFISCGGEIDCVIIDGNQITLELRFGGQDYGEVTFSGTLNLGRTLISNGSYNGWTSQQGNISGNFSGARTLFEEETQNINLNPLFGSPGPYSLRDFLPQFNECDEPVSGTMGYGLNPSAPDATLGGILPDFTQEDWDLEFGTCSTVNIPVVANGSITINGNLDDWTTQAIYTDDVGGNDNPDFTGTDIHSFYLAKDDNYLYMAMTLHDGPPSTDIQYWFMAADNCWGDDDIRDRVAWAVYRETDGWVTEVYSRVDWQQIGYHPGDAAPGADVIEWKVPLGDMGNLSGKYINMLTHSNYVWEPSDYPRRCIRIEPLSTITGTLNVPEHDGTGPVYIGVFRYDGTYNTDPENRIGEEIIYEGEYTADMTYTVTDLPVGEQVFVVAMWDSDFNGIRSHGDYVAKSASVTVASDGSTVVDLQPKTMIAGSNGEPYFGWCNVQAMNTPGGVQTALTVEVLDPDGTVPDTLNSLEVAGPEGFSYNFTGQDFVGTPFNVYWHGIPGQPAVGEYTFTVTDTEGKTATSHYYFSGGTNIPIPDQLTLQASGDALAPTLSWGGVSGYQGNLFYRARIFDPNGNITWTSGFTTSTSLGVPAGILQQGIEYKWRVEAFDNYTYSASNRRAVTDQISLTVDNSAPYFNWATVFHRHDTEGGWTQIEVGVVDPDGTLPSSTQSLEVYDPQDVLLYTFQTTDYDSGFQEYATKFSGAPAQGVYKLVVTDANNNTKTTYDYVAPSFPIPIVDSETFQASGDSLTPTLSWGVPSGIDRSLYYRVIIENTSDGSRVWGSWRTPETYMNVPSGILQSGGSYQWYVRTCDDKRWTHFSNQARSAKVTLTIGDPRPYFKYATIYERHEPGGYYTMMDVSVVDPNGTMPGSITSLSVAGPDYSYTFQPDEYDSGWQSYSHKETGQLTEGVYTFTVICSDSSTVVTSAYLKAVTDIPDFDEGSFKLSGNPLAPTVSWGGISEYQGNLYYRLWVMDTAGSFIYRSSREPVTAQTIPEGNLENGSPYMFRVEAYDDNNWVIYNARSNSNFAMWTPSGGYAYEVEARSQNWTYGQQYIVHFEVEDPYHEATSVEITGPGITGSLILDYYDTDEGAWNSWQSTGGSLSLGSTPPTPPLEYTFTVVDSSGTYVYTSTIRSFVSVVATNLSPSGTAADPLVFSWTGVGAGYTYQVQLSDADWNMIWDSDWGLTTASVTYNGDSLTPDGQYHYWVVVEDQYGNESFAEGSFTYQAAQMGQTISGNITYSGSQTGDIKVKLWSADLMGEAELETTLTALGAFTINNISDGRYYVCAFRDSDDNGNYTAGEAYGYWQDTNGLKLINLTGTGAAGINIDMADPATGPTGASVAITSSLTDSLPGYLVFFRHGDSLSTDSEPVFVSDVIIAPGSNNFQADRLDDPYEDMPVPAGSYDFYFLTGDLSEGPDNGVIQSRQAGVTISRGNIIQLNPITFNAGGTVSGAVTSDTTGNPLWNAEVYLVKTDQSIVAWCETDASGNFQFEHVPVGTYYLNLSFNGYNAYTPIAVNVASDAQSVPIAVDNTRLTPSQTPGTISGILSPFGVAVEDRVILKNGDQIIAKVTPSASDGFYTVTDVVPGVSYTLIGSARGYVPQQISVTVAAGETRTQNFTLNSTKGVIVNGLNWLLAHQRADGSFDDNLTGDADQFVIGWTGYTGLALLSIYENPKYNAGGSDDLGATLLDQIRDALYGVVSGQTVTKNGIKQYFESTYHATDDPNTGWNDIGAFFDSGTQWVSVAATPVALEKLIALGLPLSDSKVVNSVTFLLNAQITAAKARDPIFAGGWRYNPEDNDTDNWETAWVVMALMKAGVNPSVPAIVAGLDHIKRSQITGSEEAGLFAYQPDDTSGYGPLGTSAACILALNFAGEPNTEAHVASFFDWVKANPNFDGFERWADAYWWSMFPWAAILYDDPDNPGKKYYDTLGLTWSMANYIILSQQSDGRWDNPNYVPGGSRSGNSVMHTASALMAIAPYEYLTPTPEQVTVSGTVYKTDEQALTGAKVEALRDGILSATAITDGSGVYMISVPKGYAYDLRVVPPDTYTGYQRKTVTIPASGVLTENLQNQDIHYMSGDIDNVLPVIGSPNPVDTVTAPYDDPISAVLTDNDGIDPASIVFTLDGTPVAAVNYDPVSGQATYSPPSAVSNEEHTVTVDVKDYAQNSATQLTWTFTPVSSGGDIGDINNDGTVNLADAILALKVVAGMNPTCVNLGADVNGDNKIGLAEVIYILQYVAGVRE